MSNKATFCPICGKQAKEWTTWTKNRYGKKYHYKVFTHLEDGTKHYIQKNRGRKSGSEHRSIKTMSVDESVRAAISDLPFNKEIGFVELKKMAEMKKLTHINNQTFSRSLLRVINSSMLIKKGMGREVVYLRKAALEKKSSILIKKMEITISSKGKERTLQIMMYLENPEGPSESKIQLQGTIGIGDEYKKDQLIFGCDKYGELTGRNINNAMAYGNLITISIELNDYIKKGETDYVLVISKLQEDLDDFRLIMPSNSDEISVKLLTNKYKKFKEETKRLKVLLIDGSKIDFPYVKVSRIRNQLISIDSIYRGLKVGEGISINLTMD